MQELDQLVAELLKKTAALAADDRYMLGIIGYPGAGKSTTAQMLVEGINKEHGASQAKTEGAYPSEIAVVVPMDGFHRYNSQLKEMQLFDLKGVPDSFDSEAFVQLLARIRDSKAGTSGETIGCPCFDRAIEEPTPDAIQVKPEHKIVVVEGNYLLLKKPPWDKVRSFLDEVWFVDCDMAEIKTRLEARHAKGGRDPEAARAKMESTDLPNALLIESTRARADRVINLHLPDLKV